MTPQKQDCAARRAAGLGWASCQGLPELGTCPGRLHFTGLCPPSASLSPPPGSGLSSTRLFSGRLGHPTDISTHHRNETPDPPTCVTNFSVSGEAVPSTLHRPKTFQSPELLLLSAHVTRPAESGNFSPPSPLPLSPGRTCSHLLPEACPPLSRTLSGSEAFCMPTDALHLDAPPAPDLA